jgi:hypothetical protein
LYVPGGIERRTYLPFESVVALNEKPLFSSERVIFEPGIAAPEGSVTNPVMLPV